MSDRSAGTTRATRWDHHAGRAQSDEPSAANFTVHDFRPPSVIAADTDLAVALRSGDDAAVRELYDRYGGLVHTVALRIVGERGLAEEATQQTFLQAWRNSDRFDVGRDFAPWLATIARRSALDIVRRERRRPSSPLDDADPADSALTTDGPDAADIEITWALRRAIESLSPEERPVVELQHLEGLTHTEIADRLGIAVGTVKSRSFRAHRRLAQRLAPFRDVAETSSDAGPPTTPPSSAAGDPAVSEGEGEAGSDPSPSG